VLLLTGAVWMGLSFATRMARPISWLAAAAERVRSGELSGRVPIGTGNDEFSSLSRAFNRMTHQLQTQQSELIEANRQLDQRRRFSEAVLAGVSAGVIGLDQEGRINFPNRSASSFLAPTSTSRSASRCPRLCRKWRRSSPKRHADRTGSRSRSCKWCATAASLALLVRIRAERVDGEARGYVVTFDDVTELLSAQRKAAWADVARRIAHEIKNP